MARLFGSYSPDVPLDLSWNESITLEDSTGTAIDLTGFAVRAQLRAVVPLLDPMTELPTTAPLLELTTPGYYGPTPPEVPVPTWPYYEGFTVPTPTNGTILLAVPPGSFSAAVSPTNVKTKLYWDIRLANVSTGYTIPVVSGKVVFLPAVTI